MKPLRFLSSSLLLLSSLSAAYAGTFWVSNPDKDLGDVYVEMQDSIFWTFEFKNISNEPAIFTKEIVGCGCSRMFYPKDTIPAGGHGFITVVLGTEGQNGAFEKTFCLFDQKDDFYVMTLSGNAIVPEQQKNH